MNIIKPVSSLTETKTVSKVILPLLLPFIPPKLLFTYSHDIPPLLYGYFRPMLLEPSVGMSVLNVLGAYSLAYSRNLYFVLRNIHFYVK